MGLDKPDGFRCRSNRVLDLRKGDWRAFDAGTTTRIVLLCYFLAFGVRSAVAAQALSRDSYVCNVGLLFKDADVKLKPPLIE